MEESQFDVVIFGTGLVESITAAALSKAGYKVAHIDCNSYYGGDEASLSLEELMQWADKAAGPSSPTSRFQRVSRSVEVPSHSRQYSICLQPAVVPSTGPMISSLISSGVAKYSGFRLVDCVSVYDSSGHVKNVPGSKEDIFKSKEISLIEKRRLMRFLTFAAGDFEEMKELEGKQSIPFIEFLKATFTLSEEISSVIAYSLAFCMSSTEPTLPTLLRLRKYLRSAGRYGPSPFLIGHYGGIGDIAQGFCRSAAVSGGVYILGRQVTAISRVRPLQTPKDNENSPDISDEKLKFNYSIDLEDFPDTISCNLIISSLPYVPPALKAEAHQLLPPPRDDFKSGVASIARCIAIIDQALSLRSQDLIPEATDSSEEAEGDLQPPSAQTSAKDIGVDTAVLIFPPSSVAGGSTTHSATVLINGEGTLSTPKGKWIIYISLPLAEEPDVSISPETLLKPYLDALLLLSVHPSKSPIKPLFTTFYLENQISLLDSSSQKLDAAQERTYIVPPPLPFAPLPDVPDEAAINAESTFIQAIKVLRSLNTEQKEEDESEDLVFWPPLPVDDDGDENEW